MSVGVLSPSVGLVSLRRTFSAPLCANDEHQSQAESEMPKGGPGEVRRRRPGGQQGAPRNAVISVGRAAAEAHGYERQRQRQHEGMGVVWTLDQLIETQLKNGGAGGVNTHEGEHGSKIPSAAAQQEIQPVPELPQEPRHQPRADGALGQRTLAPGALGSVIPTRMSSARHEYLRPAHQSRVPHYAWLEVEQERPVQVQGWSKREVPTSPVSVIDSDIGFQDEPAEIVIIGGGPHALAALAALNEGSLQKDDTGSCCLCGPPCRLCHLTFTPNG